MGGCQGDLLELEPVLGQIQNQHEHQQIVPAPTNTNSAFA